MTAQKRKKKTSARTRKKKRADADRPSRLNALTGLLLIPVCIALLHTLVHLVHLLHLAGSNNALLARQLVWLGGGFGFWLILWFTCTRPYRSYILAHELTHALWGVVCGYRILGMHIGEEDGYVELSGSNWMVTLAPYFFPLYTLILVAIWSSMSLFMDLTHFQPFILGAVGLSWGFHLTFTLVMARRNQPDLVACGPLFAYPVVIGANTAFLCLFLVVAGSPTLEQAVHSFTASLEGQWRGLLAWIPADIFSPISSNNPGPPPL